LDRQLYLPQEWAEDAKRRQKTHVPEGVTFQESWRIGLGLLERTAADLPFGWVAGDDEFGRVAAFREQWRWRHWR
jgi:SRSO17 transposase